MIWDKAHEYSHIHIEFACFCGIFIMRSLIFPSLLYIHPIDDE